MFGTVYAIYIGHSLCQWRAQQSWVGSSIHSASSDPPYVWLSARVVNSLFRSCRSCHSFKKSDGSESFFSPFYAFYAFLRVYSSSSLFSLFVEEQRHKERREQIALSLSTSDEKPKSKFPTLLSALFIWGCKICGGWLAVFYVSCPEGHAGWLSLSIGHFYMYILYIV